MVRQDYLFIALLLMSLLFVMHWEMHHPRR
jgi:hypothetical protein